MKTCKFKCETCGFKWKGYRILPIMEDGKITGYHREKGPGQTVCPKCKEEKICWTNYDDFAQWYWKNVADGGCGGERRK